MNTKKGLFLIAFIAIVSVTSAFAQTYTYYISSHRFTGGGIDTTNCYAGAPGYLNNPSAVNLQDRGPIPPGTYYITGVTSSKGVYTIVLTPDPSNTMYGRHSFLIHGGYGSNNQTASEGCIVLEDRALRERIANAYNNRGSSVLTLYVYP